jgi:spore maturation protein SpmA
MLNYIWAFLVISGLLVAGFLGRLSGDTGVVAEALRMAKAAVMDLALPMAGMMMFWLGALRVMEKAGILEAIVRVLSPIMRRLFPEVPKDHPALSAIVMNWTANMLGLGNMATPMGLKAMSALQELNPHKSQASNSMAIFLALNTGAFTLIPMTVINYLNAGGLKNPYEIIVPTICSTACATVAAVIAAKFFQRLGWFRIRPELEEEATAEAGTATAAAKEGRHPLLTALLVLIALSFASIAALELGPPEWRKDFMESTGLAAAMQRVDAAQAATSAVKPSAVAAQTAEIPPVRRVMNGVSALAIPGVLLLALGVALARGVKVYEEFVEGAKEGFNVVTRIMPFLVTMLAALGIFKVSGMLALLQNSLRPVLSFIGFPVELLPLALMRPLSGSGATGLLNEILLNPGYSDLIKYTAGILYGSTETTFYVIAVYFGSVGIRRVRHALAAGLTADLAGMTAAILFGRLVFG